MKKLPNNSNKSNKFRLILFFLLFLIIVNVTIIVYSVGSLAKKMQERNIELIDNDEISVVTQEDPQIQNKIINILVLGLDARFSEYEDNEEGTRSDSNFILTIDLIHNKIKLSSLMRDMYVRIDGTYNINGYDKLNHAFAFGAYSGFERTGTSKGAYRAGALRSVKTVNENFGLNITDYVIFNFYSFKDIIDEMGGVDIELTQDEIDILSGSGYDVYVSPEEQEKIPLKNAVPGIVRLNGYQALNYSRIRYIGDDIERTQRQQNVMQAMYSRFKKLNIFQIPAVLTSLIDRVDTSLDNGEIISSAKSIFIRSLPIESASFPVEFEFANINDVDYVTFDEYTTQEAIHDYIFRDIYPVLYNDDVYTE